MGAQEFPLIRMAQNYFRVGISLLSINFFVAKATQLKNTMSIFGLK